MRVSATSLAGPLQYVKPRGVVRLKLGLFGAELLKCAAAQIWTKSAKVGDGRPARSREPGGPSTKRSSLLRPSKAAKAGARRASTKRSSLRGGPKAAKVGGYRPLRKKVMAPPAGQSCYQSGRLPGSVEFLPGCLPQTIKRTYAAAAETIKKWY